jgi:hypothetical protein
LKEYSDNCRNILHIGKLTLKLHNSIKEGNAMPDKGKSKSGSSKKGDKKGEKKKEKKN